MKLVNVLLALAVALLFCVPAFGQEAVAPMPQPDLYIPYFMVGGVPDPQNAYAPNPDDPEHPFRLITGFESGLVVINNCTMPTHVNVAWFGSDSNGFFQPLNFQSAGIDGLVYDANVVDLFMSKRSAGQEIFSLPSEQPVRGWIRLRNDTQPHQSRIFLLIRYKLNGSVSSEATVEPMEARKNISFYSRRYSSPKQDYVHTSFGITNPSNQPAEVTVVRRDRHGNAISTSKFTLAPMTQITRRIDAEELGGELPWAEYEGRVDFEVDVPILAVAFSIAQFGKFATIPPIIP